MLRHSERLGVKIAAFAKVAETEASHVVAGAAALNAPSAQIVEMHRRQRCLLSGPPSKNTPYNVRLQFTITKSMCLTA